MSALCSQDLNSSFITLSLWFGFQAEERLTRSNRKYTEVVAHVNFMRDNLTLTAQRVLELGARLDCKHAQQNIDDGVHAFCYKGETKDLSFRFGYA